MRRNGSALLIVCLMVFGLAAQGCGGGGEVAEEAAKQEQLAALQAAKEELEAKRQELSDLRETLEMAIEADEPEAEPAEGEEAMPTSAELEEQVSALESEVRGLEDGLIQGVVAFINTDPPVVGEPPTESQLAAIRMKSDEDLVLARSYIDEGGDYRRAMDIYETALQVDPDNAKLQEALDSAMELRYVNQERFAGIKKGMSQKEVRAVLGQVNLRNVREYPDRDGVVAWFYATGEGGAAAAVWFKEDKAGTPKVYQSQFEAVKAGGG